MSILASTLHGTATCNCLLAHLSYSSYPLFQGCYTIIKDLIFGNVYIIAGTLGGLGLIQVGTCILFLKEILVIFA